METTFYDDSQFRSREDIKMLKRTMTLDLDNNHRAGQLNGNTNNKRQKFNPLLTSPDMHMLKLASPELERLIIAQNGMVTTTPTPTQFLFPKNVTEEQEQYAQGFVQALVQLHQGTDTYPEVQCTNYNSLPQTSTVQTSAPMPPSYPNGISTASYVSASGNSFLNSVAQIKEEPQCVPSMGSTPPMSPINMESQEKIKLERKRLRNRIAASKCRRRKLERIARLEDKVRLLKGENSELSSVATRLRDQVCQLKQQVMEHVKSGCHIMDPQGF